MFDAEYADDPAQTFGKVLGFVGAAQTPEELSPPVLEHVYSNGGASDADKKKTLAEHIAMNSTLTKAAAATIVDGATGDDGKTDPKKASVAASSASASLVDIELSDPVMLKPKYRMMFGALFMAGALLSILFAFVLGLAGDPDSPPGGAYIGLGIAAAASAIGVLVLVMGYKSVTIKGSPRGK